MSKRHPVISVTGSSGAGTTTVGQAFGRLFHRLGVNPLLVEGDSFHRYGREEMRARVAEAVCDALDGRLVVSTHVASTL